jgi:hypothetical protein
VREGREVCEECMLEMGEVGELREEPITIKRCLGT